MAVVGALALGAAGQVLSGRLLRMVGTAAFRPAADRIAASPGILHGPPGQVGELTLVNPTTVRVNPFTAIVLGTHSTTQGSYEVPNDALVDLPVAGQHATLFRRDLVALTVADSQAAGLTSSGTTDRPGYLHVIRGADAASNPALPAVPANTLLLGELYVPPAGQTVTLTPYNPRTGVRGGILPVYNDTVDRPGHGAERGAYDGQYRDHPTRGLQRWSATTSEWHSVSSVQQGAVAMLRTLVPGETVAWGQMGGRTGRVGERILFTISAEVQSLSGGADQTFSMTTHSSSSGLNFGAGNENDFANMDRVSGGPGGPHIYTLRRTGVATTTATDWYLALQFTVGTGGTNVNLRDPRAWAVPAGAA